MNYTYHRGSGRGPVKAVITDLAGTVLDYGSCAPTGAFIELFHRNGVTIDDGQARAPMGLHKRDHIEEILKNPAVGEGWIQRHGKAWSEEELDRLYHEFTPIQVERLPYYCEMISGVCETVNDMRDRGITIAATTGYNREMMHVALEHAARQGFKPDAAVCVSDVSGGRPAPWMIFEAMERLGVYPPEAVVSIGDTKPDVESGINAGVWSIGVAATGNMLGLTLSSFQALDKDDKDKRLELARTELREAGSHFVIDDFNSLPGILDEINKLISQGERP